MMAYVFDSPDAATTFQAEVDGALSYPMPGVDVGGGRHATVEEGTTVHYGYILEHPDGTRWAHPSDDTIDAAVAGFSAHQQGGGKGGGQSSLTPPAPEELDATWFPDPVL